MQWLFLPAVYYTPETRWAFGGAVINTFRFRGEPLDSRPSQFQVAGAYTQNRQVLLYVPYRLYKGNEKYLLYGELGYYRYNYFFYGVGNDNPPDFSELYDVTFPRVRINAMRLLRRDLYLGLQYAWDGFEVSGLDPNGQLIAGDIPGFDGGAVSGFGLVLNYDTRDNLFWPMRGWFVEGLAYFNERFLGSAFRYSRYTLNAARYFRMPWKPVDHVLATNVLLDFATGEPPFYQMPMLGGPKRMRGYYEGRFRDRNMLLLQAEYRAPLFWRVGAVAFLNYGLVARHLRTFGLNNSRWTYGGGLRFLLDKQNKINIRVDYGYGRGGGGFYLTVAEAF